MRGKPSATNEEDLFGGSSSSQIHLVLHLGLRSRVVFSTAQSFGPVLPVFSLVKGKPWFLQRMKPLWGKLCHSNYFEALAFNILI